MDLGNLKIAEFRIQYSELGKTSLLRSTPAPASFTEWWLSFFLGASLLYLPSKSVPVFLKGFTAKWLDTTKTSSAHPFLQVRHEGPSISTHGVRHVRITAQATGSLQPRGKDESVLCRAMRHRHRLLQRS